MRRPISVAAALIFAAACAGSDTLTPGVERTTRGDTIVVRTTGDGVWGPLHDVVEVLRVAEDSPETTIGRVSMPVATPDGGVVFLDSQGPNGPIVRRFDSNGKFVNSLGREGSGPGEYSQRGQTTLAVDSSGTVIIRDGGRALSRYTADGVLASSFPLNLGRTALHVYGANDGSVLIYGALPGARAPAGSMPPMLRYSPEGALLDTVTSDAPWQLPPPANMYAPITAWIPLPDGRHLHMRTDMLGFLIIDPARRVPPLLAEAVLPDVLYLDEEREELQAIADRQRARQEGTTPAALPRAKLPSKYPVVDPAGRIWIARPATAIKVPPRVGFFAGPNSLSVSYAEPSVFAAFEPDGTFLGEVRFPVGVIPAFTGNSAWAVVEDADGIPRLVKYRVAPDA